MCSTTRIERRCKGRPLNIALLPLHGPPRALQIGPSLSGSAARSRSHHHMLPNPQAHQIHGRLPFPSRPVRLEPHQIHGRLPFPSRPVRLEPHQTHGRLPFPSRPVRREPTRPCFGEQGHPLRRSQPSASASLPLVQSPQQARPSYARSACNYGACAKACQLRTSSTSSPRASLCSRRGYSPPKPAACCACWR